MVYIKMELSNMFNVTFMGQCRFKNPWRHFSRHVKDEYILYFVKQGILYIEEEGKKYTVREGEYIILQPYCYHVGYELSEVTYYYIHLTRTKFSIINKYKSNDVKEDILKRRMESLSSDITTADYRDDATILLPKHYQFHQNFEIYKLLDAACYELNQKSENFKLFSVLITYQILIKMNRQFNSEIIGKVGQKSYVIVKELIVFLEEHLHERLTINEIESYSSLNYNYLNRIFKASTGFTIKNYLNLLKIQRAQQLIRENGLTFAEISEYLGFDDPFYFSKLFKSKTGLTPSQYKNEIKLTI